MKKIITAFVLTFSILSSAQEFSGKAIYKTHRKMDIKFGGENSTVSEAQQKQMEERMKKMFQKTFTLNFTKNESTYKEDVNLKSPNPKAGFSGDVEVMVVGNGGGNDVYYKNLKEKRYANKTDIMGKVFLIKDKTRDFKWELTGETKNIGNYTCYKATYSREQDQIKMSMVDGESKETTEKVTIVTTAWYTPQIPISNGPREFGGLPGLILEVNQGKLTMVCTEIVLNPKNKITIVEPTKGKVVSQEKYGKIMQKKSKEMMDRFKRRRGNGRDGNEVEIRIGG